jgi:uncharacterized protein (TIGR03067 family)
MADVQLRRWSSFWFPTFSFGAKRTATFSRGAEMRGLAVTFALVAIASLAMGQTTTGKGDLDALQGVWRVVGGEMQGKVMPPEDIKNMEGQLTIKGSSIKWKSSKEEDDGSIAIDPSKSPKHIDITAKNLHGGMPIKGIYELKGDDLKICFDPEAAERPTSFKTKEDTRAGVLMFKRDKK